MKNHNAARRIVFVFVLALLALLCAGVLGEGSYRTLTSGNYGDDVLALKKRLADLGYFTGKSFNNRYTDDTVSRVKAFEKACGLTQTGVATPALQALLFSDDAIYKQSGVNVSGREALPDPSIPDCAYRTLNFDSVGDDVLALKMRLYTLGYFSGKPETSGFSASAIEAVHAYQAFIGEEESDIVSVALQEHLFGTSAVAATPKPYAAVPTSVPAVTAKPTSTPRLPTQAVTLPALNEDGFLADANAEPFVHADRDDGHWYYISQNLFIEIVRKYTPRQNITWFETEIRCTEESMPRSLLAQGTREDGRNFISPKLIGEQYNAIFAISDDFYGYRWYNRITQGIIIRNGEIMSDATQPASSTKWPYLEILAIFNDGSMRVFESDEYTAQEYLNMGVTDTYAFGPILVRDGIIDAHLYDKSVVRYTDDEPRMALGCIEPYHYIVVTAKGRTSDSDGVTMHWLAERMKALGCENALNLDGGNTVALYFMGDVLNKVVNSTSYREISSMIGFTAD